MITRRSGAGAGPPMRGLNATLGGGLAALAVQPFVDRLPLLPIRPRRGIRAIEHAHAARVGAHVVLCFAQVAEIRHLEFFR